MSFKGKQNLEGRPKGSANKITTKVKYTEVFGVFFRIL
jgi:hypothetical protein|tara:strand:+ start:19 stop:132 length:114 start_codon:yes stop_codon:yes gene_type:complete